MNAGGAQDERMIKSHFRRCLWLSVLTAALAMSGLAAGKKSRVFDARYEIVWNAAVDVAKDSFLPDTTSKGEGKLRFRTGPMRGYRFEVILVDAGAGKIRVDVELRTRLYGIEKDAWRSGDRYLRLLTERLQNGRS